MSFILDALRKSEHERQRQTGPALAEVPVAAAKPRSNVWAPIAIALLLVNVAAIGVLLIRKSTREPAAPPPAALTTSTASASAATAPPASAPGNPVVAAPPPAAILSPAPPANTGNGATRNPLEEEAAGSEPVLDPQVAAQASAPPPGPPAVTRAPASRGSVVYESLPDSATVGSRQYAPQADAGQAAAAAGSGLPPAEELSASGTVPRLSLDLHVYSTTPADRLVFINSHKYREGDTLQEGPVVRQITPAGVVIEYNGRSYLLTHD